MNKKSKKLLIGVLASITMICGFSACNNKKPITDESGNTVISGDIQRVEDNSTYNNGGNFVQYKGKTYFREYSNADISKGAIGANYTYETNSISSKYINVISSNGKIENLFEDDGYGDIFIADDRFFLSGYNNKLYSVDMKGENYIEFCKGFFVGIDEENHKIYYKNQSMNNALYSVDTETLKITKLSSEDINISLISDNNVYHYKATSEGIQLYCLNSETFEISELSKILINDASINQYFVSDMAIYKDKLVVSIGYLDGSMGNYFNSMLYVVSLKENSYQALSKDIGREIIVDKNMVYFEHIENYETYENSLYKANLDTIVVSKVKNFDGSILVEDENIILNSKGLILIDNNIQERVIVSEQEVSEFSSKYIKASGEKEYFVNIRNIEQVGHKIYYLIELSAQNSEYAIGWREGYERIASEIYMYDVNTGRKTLLYLYKATDKDEIEDEELHGSGDIQEPLAENEMYLEIKLDGKGLKNTFEVRVEEVGGLIIGKRIEYEGTHSRNEETLKIKVTKEVGAMLTVYIDNKLDSQMLIEE